MPQPYKRLNFFFDLVHFKLNERRFASEKHTVFKRLLTAVGPDVAPSFDNVSSVTGR